jgi:hypothetical protein
MYDLDSTVAIVMAACIIYAAITLDGGVLVGANWLAKSGHRPMSTIVSYDLDINSEPATRPISFSCITSKNEDFAYAPPENKRLT